MLDTPCDRCARLAANPENPRWGALLAALDLGHDQTAHRIYWRLIQAGIGPDRLDTITDEELLRLPAFGVGALARLRGRIPSPASGCVFCDIATGRESAVVVRDWPNALAIVPLNPVTAGHVLVVPKDHVPDATADPEVAAQAMRRAAQFARGVGDVNLITSVGAAATQTVRHLHVHVIPRLEGDGLALPWTRQGEPACSGCGGRPKRGLIRSEDGETWQCEGCYHDLAHGPQPAGGAS